MPRPITKADIKRWRFTYSFRIKETDGPLGIIVKFSNVYTNQWSYSVNQRGGQPIFCSKETVERRKKLGHPKPRQILPDTMFSLDEMDLACSIMEELS